MALFTQKILSPGGGSPGIVLQDTPAGARTALPRDTLFGEQGNLFSPATVGAAANINIAPVWSLGFSGKGVKIGLYDTALDIHHKDLARNVDLSLRVVAPDGTFVDPTRVAPYGDEHATSVAGIIAAERNGTGIVGIAYSAKITPVDIFDGDESYFRAALMMQSRFDITNHSWSFAGAFEENPLDPYDRAGLAGFASAALHGRNGLGTLENVAAGNYREYGFSTETNGLTNDRHVVVVGAVDQTGSVASYSNPGASLLVVAPSSGDTSGVTTTDVTGWKGYSAGDYTDGFGGTSAATPQLSGIEADMLQANPHLGWRDVQTILAIAARHGGSAIGGDATGYESEAWTVNHAASWNGGGMHFSNDYGFGLIDARAAVMLALSWSLAVPAAATSRNEVAAAGATSGSWQIGGGAVQTITIDIQRHEAVEAMVLDLKDLAIDAANHLFVDLISPAGTVSHLLLGNGAEGDAIVHGWRLMSRAFRGEDSHGTWTIRIATSDAADDGRLAHLALTAYGAPAAAASVHFYTDEFAAMWDETRAVLHNAAGPVTIDAAPVTGAVCLDLAGGIGSIDGASLTVADDTRVRTIVTGTGDDTILAFGALRVFAGDGGDIVVGGAGRDELHGNGDADKIEGGAGADRLFGGAGRDTVSFAHAPHGIHVALGDSHPQSTGEGRDTIAGFEDIAGSDFADRLAGDAHANRIDGAAGDDRLMGGPGNDVLVGGDGSDTVSYAGVKGGERIDLDSGLAIGRAGRDQLDGIENLIGSAYRDTMSGDAGDNGLFGHAGGDRLFGRDGDDLLVGGAGNDFLVGGAGADRLFGGAGSDKFVLGGPRDAADVVFDFNNVSQADAVRIDRAAFDIAASVDVGGHGATNFAGYFVAGSAATADHGQFVYDRATGELFYDGDGAAADGAVLIATFFNHPALRAADFDLV